MVLADLGRPGEGDLVDARRAGRAPRRCVPSPVRTFTTPGGSPACRKTSANRRAVSGVVCSGLEDDRVPAGERRRDLPREHQEREVPRDDLLRPRPAAGGPVRERVLELVRPARVVEEVRGGEREVDVPRFADRLAAVERFERRRTRGSVPGGGGRCGRGTSPAPTVRSPTSSRRTPPSPSQPRDRRPRRLRRRPPRGAPRWTATPSPATSRRAARLLSRR